MENLAALNLAVKVAEERKASDVKTLDLRGRSSFTDYFLLATGLNRVHTKALADHLEKVLAAEACLPNSKEGYPEGEWILLDYLDFVIHIFTPEAREYYQLERLWHQNP